MTRKHLSRKGIRDSCRPPDDHKPASSELRILKASRAAGGSVASKHYSALECWVQVWTPRQIRTYRSKLSKRP